MASYGLAAITRGLRRRGLDPSPAMAMTAAALVLGLGTFNVVYARSLARQASIQTAIYGALERQIPSEEGQVVVLAPRFAQVWWLAPPLQEVGTWVFEWRKPRPDFGDRILILHQGPGDEAAVRAAFPRRGVLRLDPSPRPPYFTLERR